MTGVIVLKIHSLESLPVVQLMEKHKKKPTLADKVLVIKVSPKKETIEMGHGASLLGI